MHKVIAFPKHRFALVACHGAGDALANIQFGGMALPLEPVAWGLAAASDFGSAVSRSQRYLTATFTASVMVTPISAANSRANRQVSSFPMYRLLGVLAINYFIGRYRDLGHSGTR